MLSKTASAYCVYLLEVDTYIYTTLFNNSKFILWRGFGGGQRYLQAWYIVVIGAKMRNGIHTECKARASETP